VQMVKITFTALQPEIAFTALQPGITFSKIGD